MSSSSFLPIAINPFSHFSLEQLHSNLGSVLSNTFRFSSPVTIFAISSRVLFSSNILLTGSIFLICSSILDISSSPASGIRESLYPPADFIPFLSTNTPKAITVGVCSEVAK